MGHILKSALANDTESGIVKVKTCRKVGCSDLWVGTADVDGCITVFTKRYCKYGANIRVEYTYFGKNENCTGGEEWVDCNACQQDCVPEA